MNKICTDIKQAKKLIELGIDVNSADMIYYWFGNFELNDEWYKLHLGTNRVNDKDILTWSLSALLEYMNRNFYKISVNYCGSEYTISFDDGERYKTITKDYPIDAAFEMVCWLLENKKI